MNTVTSKDGTGIAYWRSGEGPPLVVVHGATADHTTTWRFVLSELERHYTVYAMDRRGRGDSGDSPEYELQREAEDVATVVDSISEPVNLFGHSYGALCSLEAALLTDNLRRLVLYEGVPLRGADESSPEDIARYEEMLAAGRVEEMLVVMFREAAKMPPEDIALLRSQKEAWAVRLGNAPTLPRELRAIERYTFDRVRFADMRTPTLLMVGGESPPREHENARGVAEALPDAQVVVLPGQQHTAMYAAPELFVREVVSFLR
jgi:pimeloyl-ACP methyl ester carboxylesterase